MPKKKIMNIAYVLPIYWPAIGGCELHTRELVKNMAGHHRVRVITQVDSQEQKLKARKGRVANNWYVSTVWAPGRMRSYFDNNSAVHRLGLNPLERILASAAVKFHHRAEKQTMKMLTTVFKRKIAHLINGCDIIHCVHGGVSYLGLTALQIAKKKSVPFVYTPVAHLFTPNESKVQSLQGSTNERFPELSFKPREWVDKFWFRICQQADALITMTSYEKKFFQKKGLDGSKIYPVGVGPIISAKGDAEAFRRYYGLGNERFVLFLGRKHESKGILHLLMATRLVWEKYPDVRFFFAGPLEGNTRTLFKAYSDKRIVEIGFIDDQEKANALEACDIFCVPSKEESLGGVYLEAWMHEKPIIAADIPPIQELTVNGRGGFLIDPCPEKIAEKIFILIEKPDLCKRMGLWGKEKVLSQYSWDLIAKKMEQIYLNLVNSKDASKPQRYS